MTRPDPIDDLPEEVIRGEREFEQAEAEVEAEGSMWWGNAWHEYRRQYCEICDGSRLHGETPEGLYCCTVCGSLNPFSSRTL